MQGRKTVGAGTCPAAAVADAVRTCAVPRHTNEKWPIVAEVGRPPFLRVRHQGMKVLDHGIQVEALEFFRVIELLAHWIGERRVLVQDLQGQLVRPPTRIRRAGVSASAVRYRAL